MIRGTKKIGSDEVTAAKKALKALEERNVGLTRDEALKELEKDVKEALRKGYSLKEISDILRQNGVLLPVSFLKQVQPGTPRKKRIDRVEEESAKPDGTDPQKISTSGFVKEDMPDDEL